MGDRVGVKGWWGQGVGGVKGLVGSRGGGVGQWEMVGVKGWAGGGRGGRVKGWGGVGLGMVAV